VSGFGLVARFNIRPGREQEFDDVVAATLDGIREQEPGTLIYISHAVPGEPGVRVFYELYRDRADFEAHGSQEHVKRFFDAREELVESFTVEFLDVVDAKTP
jgi:quinol monooxygenase YgiN